MGEVDGDVHLQSVVADVERDAILRAYELRIMRFKNEEVLGNLKNVLKRIAAT